MLYYTRIVRSIFPQHIRSVVSRRSSVALGSVNISILPSSNCQTRVILKCIHSWHQFRTYHLINKINICTQFKLYSTRDTSDQIEVSNDETKNKGRFLSEIPIRRDRVLSVELFCNILKEKGDGPWTSDDWVQVGELLSQHLRSPWEVMCMHTLMSECKSDVGRSLMNFLEGQPKPPGPVITAFYICLLGKTCQGNPEQEHELKKYYDDLSSNMDIFNAASIEILAEGLSHTKYYKESVRLLEMYRVTSRPGTSLLINMLLGALRNDDMEFCSDVLQHFEEDVEPTQLKQYATLIIDTALESKRTEALQIVFDFMQKHNISLLRNQLEEVEDKFQRSDPNQWKGNFGLVNLKSGKCSICGHKFPRNQLKTEDFQAIQSAFLDQVIVSDNIFFKTSPKEVQSFIKFIDKYGPFDVVIDGLNALYAVSSKKPQRVNLENLVSYYCDYDKRVLVLGSHVLRSYVQRLNKFSPRPKVYMASTTRADDAFFLYAALRSGKDTVIVSRDKLRDHKFRLDPHLRSIFARWLMSNQVYSFINPSSRAIEPKQRLYNLGPLKDDNGWHLPLDDVDSDDPFGRQGILCLRHGPENFKTVRNSDRSFNTSDSKPSTHYNSLDSRKHPRHVNSKPNNRQKKKSADNDWFDL